MSNALNYKRLSYLGDKVKEGKATSAEKDEFMKMLYQHGNITTEQYNTYLNDKAKDEVLDAGLAIGAILLIGYLLKEAIKSK